MAYLGLSPEPDYPAAQYFTSPGEPLTCDHYCAGMKSGLYTMQYVARPEGCTCPGEVDAKKEVKQIQPAPAGGGLALAAIAALLMLGA